MTFTAQVKNELAHHIAREKSCQVAELSAIIRMDGSLHLQGPPGRLALHISTENAATARKVLRLLSENFKLKGEVTIRRWRLKNANNYLVFIPEQPQLGQSLNELGILDDSLNIRYDILPRLVRINSCAAAYLRGLFLGGGSVSDPAGDYHFELVTDNYRLAADSKSLMERLGLNPKILTRKKNFAVYLKSADQIIQCLALIGAHTALLKWEDIRIKKEVRANVNRLVNFDTANLNKTVDAAISQLSDIDIIEEGFGLEKLPRALADVARARRAHPNVNIKELGEACDPPLSKSAVYHRLRRLHALAEGVKNR